MLQHILDGRLGPSEGVGLFTLSFVLCFCFSARFIDDMAQTPRSTVGTVKSWHSRQTERTGWTDESYNLHNQGLEEVEQARLRPNTNEEFPWLSQEFESIRVPNTRTRSPQRWYREGQSVNRDLERGYSQRSARSGPRESIVDLHLIVSDLDYYAGAVHDYQAGEEALCEEEELDEEQKVGDRPSKPGQEGSQFGQIQIIRNASKMGRNGTLRRNHSSKSTKEKDIN